MLWAVLKDLLLKQAATLMWKKGERARQLGYKSTNDTCTKPTMAAIALIFILAIIFLYQSDSKSTMQALGFIMLLIGFLFMLMNGFSPIALTGLVGGTALIGLSSMSSSKK